MRDLGNHEDQFRRALNAGSLPIAEGAFRKIDTPTVADTLELVALMAKASDPRYPRAAARWAALLAEDRDLGTDGVRKVLAMLELLPGSPGLLDRLRRIAASMDEWP